MCVILSSAVLDGYALIAQKGIANPNARACLKHPADDSSLTLRAMPTRSTQTLWKHIHKQSPLEFRRLWRITWSPHAVGRHAGDSWVSMTELACDPDFGLDLICNNACKDFFINALFHARLEQVRLVGVALETVPQLVCECLISSARRYCTHQIASPNESDKQGLRQPALTYDTRLSITARHK